MDACTFTLPSSLDISAVNDIHQLMIQQFTTLDTKQTIHIDAANVLKVDTAGLQLLFAFVIELTRKNIDFNWVNLTNTLPDNALRLGLHTQLKLN